ncbi:MAG: xanthine dehydrogenase family protein molybdopterin-binding subunit, partial [Acidobacteria bacterium]|nr:xanthine dehydrogenase family protein molybdopterin-binding subunit [Acidobacteriota bacterium]
MSEPKPLLGNPQTRVDGRLKVTGRARYAADTALPGGLAHAVVVGAEIATGRIAKIDVAGALAAPGALAVFTHENRPKIFRLATSFATARLLGESLQPLAGDRIHFFGQIVAVVVAGTLEEAQRAARLVRVTVEPEPAVLLREAWQKPRVPTRVDGGPAASVRKADGVASVADAFEAAEVKLRGTYTTPLEHHHPIEPHATVAEWDGDRLTVHEPSQWVVSARNLLADAFGLPEERVRVVSPFVGGGFGGKGGLWHHTVLCAAAARALGRPVKLVLTRAQMLTGTGHRPATRQEIFLGARRD